VPELAEAGVLVEGGDVLGVDVEDVEFAGTSREHCLDAAKEWFEDWLLERMKEEDESRSGWKRGVEGVVVNDADGRDARRGGVVRVGAGPEIDVALGDCSHIRVELDADDFAKVEFACEKKGAALAAAEVEECVAGEGVGWRCFSPLSYEGAEDAGGYGVVGGDVVVVRVAGDEVGGGDEAAGVGAVDLVEGMDGRGGGAEEVAGALRIL